MRKGLVVVGIVLLILGAVLMLVPLVPQASVTVTKSSPYLANITGFSITGTVPSSVTWSSGSKVDFVFGACSAVNSTGTCTGTSQSWNYTGTGGTISFNVATGGALYAGVIGNGSASINLKLAETTIGVIVIVVGILLLMLGVVLKRKSVSAPASASPEPAPGTTSSRDPVQK